MKIIKKVMTFSTVCLMFVLSVNTAFAGDIARLGTAAGVQTIIPVGARYLAMSGSNISNVEGLDGIHWNPAGFASTLNSAEAIFSTMSIFNDIDVNYIAIGVNMGDLGNLAVSLKALDFGDIPLTTENDPDGDTGQTFSPGFATIGLTYATRLTDVIEIGVTAKFISESIDRVGGTAFGVDAGIQYHNIAGFNGVSLGLVIKNIGTSMQYSGSGLRHEATSTTGTFNDYYNSEASVNDLPTSFEIGLGYKANINEQSDLLLSTNFNNYNYGSDDYRFGAEYLFNNMVAVRAGYLMSNETDADDQRLRRAYSTTVALRNRTILGYNY